MDQIVSATVEIAQGKLQGIVKDGVLRFNGIPYAKPPVGELRWHLPQAPEPWTGVRDASRFGNIAPQVESASGAVLGGTLGLLAGIGALAIPGIGPLIAAGPILSTLAGIGVGGAIGGFTGALIGVGIPEYEAKRYEGRLQKGGMLLSVHCDTSEEVDLAKEIMDRSGGEDIASTGESSSGAVPAEPRVRGRASGSTD